MIRLFVRSAPHGHEFVAGVIDQYAAVLDDDGGKFPHDAAEPVDGLSRAEAFADRGEVADVTKEYADFCLARLHLHRVRITGQLAGELGREVLFEDFLAEMLFLEAGVEPCEEKFRANRPGEKIFSADFDAADRVLFLL